MQASNLEMGSTQDIELQLALPRRSHIESCVHQQAAEMGITDDLLLNGVAAIGVGVSDLEAEARRLHAVEVRLHVAAFVMEEGLAVSDQVLNVADLRGVDGGVVDLGDDPIGHGVPDATGNRVGSSDSVFGASRPSRRNPRTTWRWITTGHYWIVC